MFEIPMCHLSSCWSSLMNGVSVLWKMTILKSTTPPLRFGSRPVEKSSPYPLKSIRSVLRSYPHAKGFSELKFLYVRPYMTQLPLLHPHCVSPAYDARAAAYCLPVKIDSSCMNYVKLKQLLPLKKKRKPLFLFYVKY